MHGSNEMQEHGHGEHGDEHQMAMTETAGELDMSTSKMSDHHRFRVAFDGDGMLPPVNVMHSWVLTVTAPDGTAVEGAEITVDGGMPAHGHGLPTAPRVTEELGDGRYRVEGVKFNMPGHWQVTFGIAAGHHTDSATFNLMPWTDAERRTIAGLGLATLPSLTADASNPVGDDGRAVALGHRLFFDTRLSANGEVSCAACHQPPLGFSDGRPVAEGLGRTARNAPTIIGIAYSRWFFWDGRKDSQWSQALGPLESLIEHGTTRLEVARLVAADADHRPSYENLFGALPAFLDDDGAPQRASPNSDDAAGAAWDTLTAEQQDAVDQVFANVGKAIAAYERRIMPGAGRFDDYVGWLTGGEVGESPLSADEVAGLRLFIGPANCTECHNGPRFTNDDFHNTGLAPLDGDTSDGRASGVGQALADPFNCLGDNGAPDAADCAELRFAKTDGPELRFAFKTPTLRHLSMTAPYVRDGRFATLAEVLDHYNRAARPDGVGSELKVLDLDARALAQLEAFLRTLDALIDAPPHLLEAP